MYSVSIRGNQRVKHKLSLIGMDRITTNQGTVDIGVAYEMFPHIKLLIPGISVTDLYETF